MSYAVVTPARNEAGALPTLAESLAAQSLRPARWIVVENGSTDETPRVLQALTQQVPFLEVHEVKATGRPVRGAHIVRAFESALPTLDPLPDVVVKVDADITFPWDHFEQLMARFARDERLARPWAVPGTPGLVHRIGGLEREDGTGNISYDPENHERMTHLRQAKVDGIADDIPPLEVDDPSGAAELLVLGWGSSLGTIRAAAGRVRAAGGKVATAHLRHLNPFPSNTGDVVKAYPKVLIPEMNLGQLAMLIRAKFLVDAKSFTKVQGLPIFAEDLENEIKRVLDE